MAANDKVSNEAYTTEYLVTDFGDESGFVCSGNAILRGGVLTADLAAVSSVTLSHWISLFGKPTQLKLTVRGGAPGYTLRLSIDSHFQSFSRVIGTLDGGEKVFSFPPPPEGWEHSGAAEGQISHPLRVSALVLDRNEGPPARTEVALQSLTCTTDILKRDAVTLMAAMKETGTSGVSRTFAATCTAWNLLDTDANGTLSMIVRDWDENVLQERSRPWTLPAKGRRTVFTWEAAVPERLNFADVEFRFTAEGPHEAATRASYTKPLVPLRFTAEGLDESISRANQTKTVEESGDASLRPGSPWGMGVYLYRYGDDLAGRSLMDRAAELAQAAGVKWTREEFNWARMEPQRGQFDFSSYDVVVDTARRHGISVYGLLAYWTDWTKPYTEEGINDFCRWTRATVHHFKDRVKHWEIYNEPNIFFWEGPKEMYPVLVKKCYSAIKQEDPEAQVLAVSTSGIERKFIARVLEAGAPFDVLTIHPYRPRLADAGFMRELRETAKLVEGRPVWITEMGWSTQIGGTDERKQAQLLARTYLCAVASKACQNVSWYDFRNDGSDPFYNEANFGVLYQNFSGKPAFRALASVCRNLADGKPIYRKKFEKDGVFVLKMGDAAAVWTNKDGLTIQCSHFKHGAKALNLMGEGISLDNGGEGRVTIPLRADCPIFLLGEHVRVVKVEKTS
jgi:hypothetical protein